MPKLLFWHHCYQSSVNFKGRGQGHGLRSEIKVNFLARSCRYYGLGFAKRRAGAPTRAGPSFGMTTTQDIRDLFTLCSTLVIDVNWSCNGLIYSCTCMTWAMISLPLTNQHYISLPSHPHCLVVLICDKWEMCSIFCDFSGGYGKTDSIMQLDN